MNKEENILGTEKIGKLIMKFSLPCIISMLVNALYNIVDQIFVGRGVGYLGNGATTIIFPLVMMTLGFSLMVGDGTSAYLSLKLGEKKEKEAAKGVGNGIIMGIIISIIMSSLFLIFLPKLVMLFGCTEELKPYALDYGYIIICGFPFMMMGTILNGLIRADGKPNYSMATMVTGAVLNTILDPILIFVFNMGVKGAAIATIFSQFITAILNLAYIRKIKSVTLNKESFKLEGKTVRKLLALGISSFINQVSVVILVAVENNMLNKCGSLSKFGPNIPITVLGIVMKISHILTSIILGVAIGAQPIIGYNYGARKLDRVKKTLKYVLTIGTVVSIFSFIIFQTIPDKLISIFGQGDELYIEFACMAFRIYLMFCFLYGVQIPTGIFFQAIGKSIKSAAISLSRQLIFLVPAMIIFGNLYGIEGVLYSGPFADAIAIVIAAIMLTYEVKHLTKAKQVNEADKPVENTQESKDIFGKHLVITISREYGSGGRYVGKLLADKLGVKVYDKEIIEKVAEETGLSKEYISDYEERRTGADIINDNAMTGGDELFVAESNVIKKIAQEESCVIIGRCADFILKDNKDVINIFIYNSYEDKIRRATEIFKMNKKEAEKEIKRINKYRENHYNHYTGRTWGSPSNYDICINSDFINVEKTCDIIYDMIKEKYAK